jgi:putative ABC transport system substrate-binding protein
MLRHFAKSVHIALQCCVTFSIVLTSHAAGNQYLSAPAPGNVQARQGTVYSTIANPRADQIETANQTTTLRYDAASLLLAELEEPLKTQAQEAHIPTTTFKGAIAVVYPDLGEPYHGIFAKIIEGIEIRSKIRVRDFAIGPTVDVADLNTQLKRGGTKVVIALGRQGLQTASSLDRDIAVVVGGVLSVPIADQGRLSGISLTPDPGLLFSRLKNLRPGVKRVVVVYDPTRNDWLIKLARDAAKTHGLELIAYEARDIATAARLYEVAFAGADSRQDAVWLPQDATTVDEGAILPLVLKEAWNRGVPVFSSSFLHVKKGALFALYPDNLALGEDLANIALAILAGDPPKRGVQPLRSVQTAVNLRTANHIGLTIGYQQQRGFDYVFPEP